MVRTRAGPLLVALLVAVFLYDSSAQVVTTTLPALLGAVGTLSLQPATYSFSSTESANITSSLVVAGQGNVEGAATASTLDLSTYPALANSTAQRPIIIQPGAFVSRPLRVAGSEVCGAKGSAGPLAGGAACPGNVLRDGGCPGVCAGCGPSPR